MEKPYKHKKQFGQHFLKDRQVVTDTVALLKSLYPEGPVLEIGPGMGVLTEKLLENRSWDLYINEIDRDLLPELKIKFPFVPEDRWKPGDFLEIPLDALGPVFALTGNFPYNISTQIVFRLLDERARIPVMVGMFQREVGERFAAGPGSKVYGITSVLARAYYTVRVHIRIPPGAFNPPPKVHSVVISMVRKPDCEFPDCSYGALKRVVKSAFSQRRKTLRNALKSLQFSGIPADDPVWNKRAEQLDVSEFVRLVKALV